LCGLSFPTDENVIVGLTKADDAGVYKISDDLALVQTVDFFTPVVDDPYDFGQIAAANALSDVYAMGGEPKTAMNLVGFPLKTLDLSILRRILEGGMDKLREAGVVLVGGHSIEDAELKYGLSITGFIHPDRVLTKGGLQAGDQLILTKPLGVGIINTAIKAGVTSPETLLRVTRLMATLNRVAAQVMKHHAVHACTDITGFGFLGHMAEMVAGSGKSVVIHGDNIPVLSEALAFADMGLIPGGAYRNREFRESMVTLSPKLARAKVDCLFDPQTSGGLLICVEKGDARNLLDALHGAGVGDATLVGEVVAGEEKILVV
jgi:selenide, water dikinase